MNILGDPGAVSRAGRKGATKVFKYRRKSPWVPTLTGPFPNGQENAGSWLGTKKCFVLLCPIGKQHLLSSFREFDSCHKIHLLALLCTFTYPNDRFPYPLIYFQLVKSLPFHIPEAWKRYPFRSEPSRIGHHREYLRPRGRRRGCQRKVCLINHLFGWRISPRRVKQAHFFLWKRSLHDETVQQNKQGANW